MILIEKQNVITYHKVREGFESTINGITFDAVVKVNCKHCNKEVLIPVTEHSIEAYSEGVKVQNAFPYLNADDREAILTNTCKECWDNLMKDLMSDD